MNPSVPSRPGSAHLVAPAKLTVSLRITGTRPDGYHLLDAEMVSLDLADDLDLVERPGGPTSLTVASDPDAPLPGPPSTVPTVPTDGNNLVVRALDAVGRYADVMLTKRIPPGAGLGGGSADAGAVLRWAGCDDPAVAASVGADVAFCVRGGRARVTGIGDVLSPLPFAARTFVLLLSPFGMDTAAVYRAYDRLTADGRRDGPPGDNDLEEAALAVDPRLAGARDALASATGSSPRLAGSGSTWFAELPRTDPVVRAGRRALVTSAGTAWLVPVRTVPTVSSHADRDDRDDRPAPGTASSGPD